MSAMALMRSPAGTILSLLCVVISVQFAGAYGPRAVVGGRREIVDVKANEEVQELGRFSVDEYNRRRGSELRRFRGGGDFGAGELRFVEVVEAQRQVVSGVKYYLKVKVASAAEAAAAERGGGDRRTFDSVVVVRPWLKSKLLLGFSPSSDRGGVRS